MKKSRLKRYLKINLRLVWQLILLVFLELFLGTIILSLNEFNNPFERPYILFVSGTYGLATFSALACVSFGNKNSVR